MKHPAAMPFFTALAILAFPLISFATPPEHVLYRFRGYNNQDGANPVAALVADSAGNLYGTTSWGGVYTCPKLGCGVVFELQKPADGDTVWNEVILYSFQGGADGSDPYEPLIFDGTGDLYGVTSKDGTGNSGNVFELTPPSQPGGAWTKTTLYNFQNYDTPSSGLLLDAAGNLYGETVNDNSNGTIYELSPPPSGKSGWTYDAIYEFQPWPDGAWPLGGLAYGPGGAFYGTTESGGRGNACNAPCGTVFKLTPPVESGGSWKEQVLFSFTGGPDGARPSSGVIWDGHDSLLGTTPYGGNGDYGVVFKLTLWPNATWHEKPIYNFTAGTDGGRPFAGLARDRKGNLYSEDEGTGYDHPLIYRISPPPSPDGEWTETTLYQFSDGWDGGGDPTGVILNPFQTELFGVTDLGGLPGGDHGVVYRLVLPK
jgi:hypothetical protein